MMIAMLRGRVLHVGANDLVCDVGGVGYLVHTTPALAATLAPGSEATLHTSMVVREDSMTLFGFAEVAERDAFELVQRASGVGPKLAAAMVAILSPAEIRRAVLTEDLPRLTSVPGIGTKGAQKIVIELKDKVLLLPDDSPTAAPTGAAPRTSEAWREQVSDGLVGLGWSVRDAGKACDEIAHLVEDDPKVGIGVLMRAALGTLARR